MQSKRIINMLALTALACPTVAGADVLVDWDFSVLAATGSTGDNSAVGGDANINESAGVVNLIGSAYANAASGISVTGITDYGTGLLYSTGSPAAGEANVKQWDLGVGDGTNDAGLVFTITADVADTLNLASISISQWRNGGGAPDGMAFEVSVDGGAFALYDSVQVDGNSGDSGFDTFTFTQAIVGADSVAIRFAPRKATQGSTGNLHINGLTVEGSVIPEPTSLALLGLGGLLIARRRRA